MYRRKAGFSHCGIRSGRKPAFYIRSLPLANLAPGKGRTCPWRQVYHLFCDYPPAQTGRHNSHKGEAEMLYQLIGVCPANSLATSRRLAARFAVPLAAAIFPLTGCPPAAAMTAPHPRSFVQRLLNRKGE
jgi:hypothetical protein